MSVPPMASRTRNSGVTTLRPSTLVTMCPSTYSSVTGRNRRAARTSRLSSTLASSLRCRKSCTAVHSSSSPNSRNMKENSARSVAPSAMRIARSTSASRIPNVRTSCWYLSGTANVDMMITKTKRLSTDRLFSTR